MWVLESILRWHSKAARISVFAAPPIARSRGAARSSCKARDGVVDARHSEPTSERVLDAHPRGRIRAWVSISHEPKGACDGAVRR